LIIIVQRIKTMSVSVGLARFFNKSRTIVILQRECTWYSAKLGILWWKFCHNKLVSPHVCCNFVGGWWDMRRVAIVSVQHSKYWRMRYRAINEICIHITKKDKQKLLKNLRRKIIDNNWRNRGIKEQCWKSPFRIKREKWDFFIYTYTRSLLSIH